MNRLLIVAGLALGIAACATSPLGRSQLNLFSDAQMDRLGATAYAEIRQSTPVSRDRRARRFVRCVSEAVTDVAGSPGERWQVTLFEDPSANAFALPGGKIGVNTGLLEVARNQDQLATVIGHEVAHVIARHGAERMSQEFATKAGLDLARALSGAPSPTRNAIFGALGVGAKFGILLPYSRTQESEADLLGLDLMAKAGFDPRESVELWQNMERAGGRARPEFLSTHPSSGTRIADLQARIPQAMRLYQQARQAGRRPRCAP
jgi:predicted Zn-dependent protease